ncbi:MAG: hypothetical protein M1591_04430 [Deltaproteobacteria bacterium]|nr:hypothetical protein [Deltaproteobacteria bacterium]
MKFPNKIMFFGMMVLAVAIIAAGCGGNVGGNGGPVNKEVLQQSLAKALQGIQITCAFNVDYSDGATYTYMGSMISVDDKNATSISSILNGVNEQYPSVSIRTSYSYVDLNGSVYSRLGAMDITQPGQVGSGTLSLEVVVFSFDSNGASSVMFTETVATNSCPAMMIYPRYELFGVYDYSGNKINADLDSSGNVITTASSGLTITLPSLNQCVSGETITITNIFFTTTTKAETTDSVTGLISPEQLPYFSYADQPIGVEFAGGGYSGDVTLGYNYMIPQSLLPGQSFQTSLTICNHGDLASGTYQEEMIVYDPGVDFNAMNIRSLSDPRRSIFAETVVPLTLIVP